MSEDPQGTIVYSGTRGYLDLRRLIADDWARHQGETYDPETEVILSEGATEAIFAAFHSILNKNDEVILTDPTYLGYLEAAQLAGGRIARLPVSVKDGYQPSLEVLKSLVNRRTKAVVLLSPDNPTGRIARLPFVKGLLDLAVDNDFWIIYDATYRDIVYGENIQPKLTSLPGAHERVISVGSFSKEASCAGIEARLRAWTSRRHRRHREDKAIHDAGTKHVKPTCNAALLDRRCQREVSERDCYSNVSGAKRFHGGIYPQVFA